MRLETKKYLFDIVEAGKLLLQFSAGKTFEDYAADSLLRSAVERQLEIIGEALAQLVKSDPAIGSSITEYRRIIAFRNVLVHGYAQVDHRIVWDILNSKLGMLLREAQALLAEGDQSQNPADLDESIASTKVQGTRRKQRLVWSKARLGPEKHR